MDYSSIEKRIAEVEEILGIDDFSNTRSIPSEIESLRRKLKDECNADLLMSIPIKKLESLNKIALEASQSSGSLSEKLESVTFSESLIKQRVELMKEFESCLENAMDNECFSKVIELQPLLEEEIRICEDLLEKWKIERANFLRSSQQYSAILRRISERIMESQRKIEQITSNA